MGKSEWDGYDYKTNYDSSISYDEPSSYRIALEYDDVMIYDSWKVDLWKSRIQDSAHFSKIQLFSFFDVEFQDLRFGYFQN